MNCKFCNAELPEDMTLCPECGKENLEEIPETVEELTEEEIAAAVEEAAEASIVEETAEAQTEEAPAKKLSLWVKILAAVGALALVAVLVGAVLYGAGVDLTGKGAKSYTVSNQKAPKVRDDVVATVGDLELTNSELQVYYWQSVNDFYSSYGYYLDASMLDMSKPLEEQFYDEAQGITWQMFFVENGMDVWSRYAALCMQSKADGFALDAEMQSYLDSIPAQLDDLAAGYGFATVEEMLEADMSPVCDKEGYLSFLHTNFLATRYLDTKYETLIPSQDEIDIYYLQNAAALNEQGIVNDDSMSVDVRHILICPKGGTEDEAGNITYSDAEWETCRSDAQKLLDQWLAGDKTEDSFAQLATENTEDPGSMDTGGLYTDVRVGQMVEPFEKWCFDGSRKSGDTGLVQTNYGYHVMYYVSGEKAWIADVRDAMINERSLALVNDAVAAWPMEVNHKKIAIGIVEEVV